MKIMTKLEPIDFKIQVRDMVTKIYEGLKVESKDFGELLEHDMKRARIEPICKRRNRADLKGERFI